MGDDHSAAMDGDTLGEPVPEQSYDDMPDLLSSDDEELGEAPAETAIVTSKKKRGKAGMKMKKGFLLMPGQSPTKIDPEAWKKSIEGLTEEEIKWKAWLATRGHDVKEAMNCRDASETWWSRCLRETKEPPFECKKPPNEYYDSKDTYEKYGDL